MHRIFLLSPAHTGGLRAGYLLRSQAEFEMAQKLRSETATLGEVFAFCSGLYFRGKLAYAARFARPPLGMSGAQVITTSRGLVPAGAKMGTDDLREFASVPIDPQESRFTGPLEASVKILAEIPDCEVVLLGSIATGKYVDSLLPVLGARLLFPEDFVGRGDMSRGGLMLRCAAESRELKYVPVAGALRRGPRPRKLPSANPRKKSA